MVDAWWLVVRWWYHPICLYSCLCDVCVMSASSLVSLSSCLPIQKAGFLYIEQAFAEADTVFRCRVVLAVSSAHVHSVYPLPHLCLTLAPPPLPDRNAWTPLVALLDNVAPMYPMCMECVVDSHSVVPCKYVTVTWTAEVVWEWYMPPLNIPLSCVSPSFPLPSPPLPSHLRTSFPRRWHGWVCPCLIPQTDVWCVVVCDVW